ncbi:MAG TPA: hypothetical protein VGL36_35560 [Kribbella sp.]
MTGQTTGQTTGHTPAQESGQRVMVDKHGDRWLVTSMTALTRPADRNALGFVDLWTHDVRARKWVNAARGAYWGPELSMHVNATGWTEEVSG